MIPYMVTIKNNIIFIISQFFNKILLKIVIVVGRAGFEPATISLKGCCSTS